MYKFILVILLFSISLIATNIVHADILIVVNNNFAVDDIPTKKLKKLWLGKTKKLDNVGRVYVVDQLSTSAITRQFYEKIINKKPKQVKAYWAKIEFIGKGFPPKAVLDDAAVINWILEKDNRIGYINEKSRTNKLKVLKTITGQE